MRCKFKDSKKYPERLKAALESTGETDALVVVGGAVMSVPLVAACFEFDFMGGSMGSVVGERFVRGVEAAVEQKMPFVSFTATGGARMQEGLLSLLQMAKTNAALTRLAKAGLPYVSVLTDPTMGGVSASFAFVGDVVIAEPKALIGFAGPRVIENTVREKLPEGFQRSEFLLGTGALDMIVDRRQLRPTIARAAGHAAAPERRRRRLTLSAAATDPAMLAVRYGCASTRLGALATIVQATRIWTRAHDRCPTTLQDWLAHCERLHPKTIDLTLERMVEVARAAGHRVPGAGDHGRRHQRQGLDLRDAGVDRAATPATGRGSTRSRNWCTSRSAVASAANGGRRVAAAALRGRRGSARRHRADLLRVHARWRSRGCCPWRRWTW